jgi:hypothetical protein
VVWRWHVDERRAQLAADVRALAGLADSAVVTARRLGADVPEGVAACQMVWSYWADRLAAWAREGDQ